MDFLWTSCGEMCGKRGWWMSRFGLADLYAGFSDLFCEEGGMKKAVCCSGLLRCWRWCMGCCIRLAECLGRWRLEPMQTAATAMQTNRFEAMGANRTYWDFIMGYGLIDDGEVSGGDGCVLAACVAGEGVWVCRYGRCCSLFVWGMWRTRFSPGGTSLRVLRCLRL